jgi:hypothetical protein
MHLGGRLGLVFRRRFIKEVAFLSKIDQEGMSRVSLLQGANSIVRHQAASDWPETAYLIRSSGLFPVITLSTSKFAIASAYSGSFFSA